MHCEIFVGTLYRMLFQSNNLQSMKLKKLPVVLLLVITPMLAYDYQQQDFSEKTASSHDAFPS